MTKEIPSNDNDLLADAYQTLQRYSLDAEFQSIFIERGPLTIGEVDPSLRQSEAFTSFVGEYGWPSNKEDGEITPVPTFESDEHFLEAFTSGTEVDGERYFLNNFKMWIAAMPNTDRFKGISEMYGTNPALLRANVLVPDFMAALREAYMALPKVTYYPSDETLQLPEAELVVGASHDAYRLLSRLLKASDTQLQADILLGKRAGSNEREPITDAATTLSA